MKIKYIILDFGKVIAGPKTNNWFITPKIKSMINQEKYEEYQELFNENKNLINGKIKTIKEEYKAFYKFYKNILKLDDKIIEEITKNFVYEIDKYHFYANIEKELEELSQKYTLLMLTDNWPSIINILKKKNIYKYFDKIYVSSIYGTEKKNKDLFDYPINDYNIKKGEAIFIDDQENLLDIAASKGLKTLQMDRTKKIKTSKHKIIYNLSNIEHN